LEAGHHWTPVHPRIALSRGPRGRRHPVDLRRGIWLDHARLPKGRIAQRFFVEGGATVLGQSDELEGNSSNVNFLTNFGVGYKWDGTGWHVVAKVQHISNAGLAEHNAGANAVGVGAGYSF